MKLKENVFIIFYNLNLTLFYLNIINFDKSSL